MKLAGAVSSMRDVVCMLVYTMLTFDTSFPGCKKHARVRADDNLPT